MNARSGSVLPFLRAAGVIAAVGLSLIPRLDLAAIGALATFVIAWMAATVATTSRWSTLPSSLRLLHIGISVSVLATIIRIVQLLRNSGEIPTFGAANAIAVIGIALSLIGTWQAARARAAIAELADILDAVAVAVVPMALVIAATDSYLLDSSEPIVERLWNVAILAVDFGFFTLMILLIFGPGTRDRAAIWLAASGLTVVAFDVLVYLGIALDGPLRNAPIRTLSLAVTFYAIATSYDSYASFAAAGTRDQTYRTGHLMTAALGTAVLLGSSVTASPLTRATMTGLATIVLIILAVRVHHSVITSRRLNTILDTQAQLAQALSQVDTEEEALRAATHLCRELIHSRTVVVARSGAEHDAPIVAQTERVVVTSRVAVPSYLRVAFDQVAHVVDFAIDSIDSRTERAATVAAIDATTDPTTGWRTYGDFVEQSRIDGVVAIVECNEISTLSRTQSTVDSDNFVRQLAARLSSLLTKPDLQLRLWRGEGSTFIVATDDEQTIQQVADSLADGAYVVDGTNIDPVINIGATSLESACAPGEALVSARLALDQCDSGSVCWFSTELKLAAERRWAITSSFRRALDDPGGAGFCVHYQGIVDTVTATPVAVEALARWVHPTLGPISPGEFIPIAEQTGLVDALDRWVLSTALTDLTHFRAIEPTLKVHTNLSPAGSIGDKLESLAHTIRLQHADLADALVIELTETAIDEREVADLERACRRLRATGAGLAIDDFGTGQSNLARLSQLPFTEIKLGAEFATSKNSSKMLATMVPTIKALGLPLVAENVETEEQLAGIQAAGVDCVQGYFFSRPQALAETLLWLEEQIARPTPWPNGAVSKAERTISEARG